MRARKHFTAVAVVFFAGCGDGRENGTGQESADGGGATSVGASTGSASTTVGAGGATGEGGGTASGSTGSGGDAGAGGATSATGSSSTVGSGGAGGVSAGSGGATTGGGGTTAGGGGTGSGGTGSGGTGDGRDAGGGVAVCWPDSMVIKICHQLENACENCPPGGPGTPLADACFALVAKAYAGMADDAACAKFAVDNKCKVDSGGNVCGSLDCSVPGCMNPARCEDRKGWGDTTQCKPFLATCPCR